jgi:hypothetical protein
MQKTQQLVNNPISNEALDLINFYDEDESRKPTDKVFTGFNDSLTQAPLKNWLREAGITKHVSYHCFSHSKIYNPIKINLLGSSQLVTANG